LAIENGYKFPVKGRSGNGESLHIEIKNNRKLIAKSVYRRLFVMLSHSKGETNEKSPFFFGPLVEYRNFPGEVGQY
jgi:hypothetical protein